MPNTLPNATRCGMRATSAPPNWPSASWRSARSAPCAAGRALHGVPPVPRRVRQLRRRRPAPHVPRTAALVLRGGRRAYEAHRRLSRTLRPQRGGNPLRATAAPLHLRPLAHPQGAVRPHTRPAPHQLQGWHAVRTLVRFTIDGADIRDLEVIELSESSGQ